MGEDGCVLAVLLVVKWQHASFRDAYGSFLDRRRQLFQGRCMGHRESSFAFSPILLGRLCMDLDFPTAFSCQGVQRAPTNACGSEAANTNLTSIG